MKPLKGYTNVTDQLIRKPCEHPDCTKTAEIPTKFDEENHKFTNWYCIKHAMKVFSKRKT
jgi:hypothetical protein